MADPDGLPPLPDDVPPPVKAPSTAGWPLFGRIVLIATGLGGGFVLGLLGSLFAPALFGVQMRFEGKQDTAALLTVGSLTFLAIVAIAVVTWRRGLRGLPLGLLIGASLGTLLIVACAVG